MQGTRKKCRDIAVVDNFLTLKRITFNHQESLEKISYSHLSLTTLVDLRLFKVTDGSGMQAANRLSGQDDEVACLKGFQLKKSSPVPL